MLNPTGLNVFNPEKIKKAKKIKKQKAKKNGRVGAKDNQLNTQGPDNPLIASSVTLAFGLGGRCAPKPIWCPPTLPTRIVLF